MLRKSMAETKLRFLGHIVRKNGMEKRLMQLAREDGRQSEKGQTSSDLVPGFERMDQAGHCCCTDHNWRTIGKDGENNWREERGREGGRERENLSL